MEKLKQNIITHYKDNTKEIIKDLKQNGYIITDKGVYQVNAFNKTFDMVEMDNIIDLVNGHAHIYWNIPYEMQQDIVKNTCLEILPMTTKQACDNYLEYVEITSKMIDNEKLQNEVKILIKDNEKRHKKVFKGGYNSPEHQSQVLINNNVFYNKGYWIFDKTQNKFVQIGVNEITQMLVTEYGNKFNATALDIKDYMTVTWPLIITNTDLPKRYNNQMANNDAILDLKKDYNKLNKIIRNCQ